MGNFLVNKIFSRSKFLKTFINKSWSHMKKSDRFNQFSTLKNDFENQHFDIFEEVVHNFDKSNQKYSRLVCYFSKGWRSVFLGWSGSILQFRQNIIRAGSKSWLLSLVFLLISNLISWLRLHQFLGTKTTEANMSVKN